MSQELIPFCAIFFNLCIRFIMSRVAEKNALILIPILVDHNFYSIRKALGNQDAPIWWNL